MEKIIVPNVLDAVDIEVGGDGAVYGNTLMQVFRMIKEVEFFSYCHRAALG